VLLVLPLVADPFTNQTIARILVFAVAVLGLNIVMGYAGQVSLGQVFFVGLGAYAAAITIESDWAESLGPGLLPVVLVAAFALAVVVPAVAGLVIALAAVRLRGLALALVTIALPIMGVPLLKRFSDLTGGSEGMSARFIPRTDSFPYQDQIQYYLILAVAAVVFALAAFLVRGKFGRAFAIVKENEAIASSMGISPYRYKVLAFTIAAIYGGVSGFLYVVAIQFISPDIMGLGHSIELVIATIVGGAGSIVGSLLGGIFYVLIPQITNAVAPGTTTVVQGVIILLVLFLLPGGLASLPRVLRRLARRRGGQHVGPGDPAPASARSTPARAPAPALEGEELQ
jgi:branched-chain amino acid transport system permease protein